MNTRLGLSIAHGIVSGLLISFAGLLMLRVNPMLAVQDLPDRMAEEVGSLPSLHTVDGYETTLVVLLMVPLCSLLIADLSRRLSASGPLSPVTAYLAAFRWFLAVFLVDLIVLDWGVYATLHLPALGIEHLVSPAALAEFQSYSFHAGEHFAHPVSYLAIVLGPVVLAVVLVVADRLTARERVRRARRGAAGQPPAGRDAEALP